LDPGDEPLEDFAESDVENSLSSLFTVPNSSSKQEDLSPPLCPTKSFRIAHL
jgi:hypothetical protein